MPSIVLDACYHGDHVETFEHSVLGDLAEVQQSNKFGPLLGDQHLTLSSKITSVLQKSSFLLRTIWGGSTLRHRALDLNYSRDSFWKRCREALSSSQTLVSGIVPEGQPFGI